MFLEWIEAIGIPLPQGNLAESPTSFRKATESDSKIGKHSLALKEASDPDESEQT